MITLIFIDKKMIALILEMGELVVGFDEPVQLKGSDDQQWPIFWSP